MRVIGTHRDILSKSYSIKSKSDCIYHFPIDLELNGRPFQINRKMANTMRFRFDLIRFQKDSTLEAYLWTKLRWTNVDQL